jgi:hypothetical protein
MKIKINRKKTILVPVLFIITVALMYSLINIISYYINSHTFKWQSPVVIQKPLIIKQKAIITQSIGSTIITIVEEKQKKINSDEFFDIIWKQESSKGLDTTKGALHNYCRSIGKWNEIGYNPQEKYCFRDKEEAQLWVAYYLKKNCNGMTMAQALCYWNTGKFMYECAYSKGLLSLAN